jgi:hypothetical protein
MSSLQQLKRRHVAATAQRLARARAAQEYSEYMHAQAAMDDDWWVVELMQLALYLPPPRARKRDPETSHAAAAKASRFSESHAGRIHVALTQGPATAHELAERTGLTVVQIDRRLPDLAALKLARVVTTDGKPVEEGGTPETRDGFRVWEAVR